MERWPGRVATDLLQTIHQFAFPRSCIGCGCSLEDLKTHVCLGCLGRMRGILRDDASVQRVLRKLRHAAPVTGLTVLFYFEQGGVLQTLVHQLKYSGMRQLGRHLGALLGEKLSSVGRPPPGTGLVPVPLHRVKQRERGYNQCIPICEGISSVLGLSVLPGLLRRTRYTESQTSLTSEERSINVREAFCVRRRARVSVSGRRLILVDDVLTTGATMAAAAQALDRAGAASISVCALGLAIGGTGGPGPGIGDDRD